MRRAGRGRGRRAAERAFATLEKAGIRAVTTVQAQQLGGVVMKALHGGGRSSQIDEAVQGQVEQWKQRDGGGRDEDRRPDKPPVERPNSSVRPRPEQPRAEQPKVEQPKAEKPRPEQPKVEQPKAEKPKAEKPKAEQPKAEQPKAERPKAEQPKAEQPKAPPSDGADDPGLEPEPDYPTGNRPKTYLRMLDMRAGHVAFAFGSVSAWMFKAPDEWLGSTIQWSWYHDAGYDDVSRAVAAGIPPLNLPDDELSELAVGPSVLSPPVAFSRRQPYLIRATRVDGGEAAEGIADTYTILVFPVAIEAYPRQDDGAASGTHVNPGVLPATTQGAVPIMFKVDGFGPKVSFDSATVKPTTPSKGRVGRSIVAKAPVLPNPTRESSGGQDPNPDAPDASGQADACCAYITPVAASRQGSGGGELGLANHGCRFDFVLSISKLELCVRVSASYTFEMYYDGRVPTAHKDAGPLDLGLDQFVDTRRSFIRRYKNMARVPGNSAAEALKTHGFTGNYADYYVLTIVSGSLAGRAPYPLTDGKYTRWGSDDDFICKNHSKDLDGLDLEVKLEEHNGTMWTPVFMEVSLLQCRESVVVAYYELEADIGGAIGGARCVVMKSSTVASWDVFEDSLGQATLAGVTGRVSQTELDRKQLLGDASAFLANTGSLVSLAGASGAATEGGTLLAGAIAGGPPTWIAAGLILAAMVTYALAMGTDGLESTDARITGFYSSAVIRADGQVRGDPKVLAPKFDLAKDGAHTPSFAANDLINVVAGDLIRVSGTFVVWCWGEEEAVGTAHGRLTKTGFSDALTVTVR